MVKKNYDDMLSRFHPIPGRYGRTDGQTDGRTDRIAISISRVSMLTRDKNYLGLVFPVAGLLRLKEWALRQFQLIVIACWQSLGI